MPRLRRVGWVATTTLIAAPLLFASHCSFPEYVVASDAGPADGSIATDDVGLPPAIADASTTLADGRICTGHDDDGDGIPDTCDDCPNVYDPSQSGVAIGSACAPPPDLLPTATRLDFDPFVSTSAWTSLPSSDTTAPFAAGATGSTLEGGTTGDSVFRFAMGSTGAASDAISATTIVTLEGGSGAATAGLLVRISGDATTRRFILCGVTATGVYVAAHAPDGGCSDGSCGPSEFSSLPATGADAGPTPVQAFFPSDVPSGLNVPIGLRLSISSGATATDGELECRVFDPIHPETLLATSDHAVRVAVATSHWIASGEVGVYAAGARAAFASIDVLSSP